MKVKTIALRPLVVTFRNLLRKPVTVQYPEEKLTLPDRTLGLHSLDMKTCIGCGMCARVCPNKTIKLIEVSEFKNPKNPKNLYPEIYWGRCMFCGLCAEFCPTKCLKLTTNYELSTYDRPTLVYSPKNLAKLQTEGKESA